jgi:hypothetical protein
MAGKGGLRSRIRHLEGEKAAESERMIRMIKEDNQRLEQHIEDRKLIDEQCKERRIELSRALRKVLASLKEVDHEVDS